MATKPFQCSRCRKPFGQPNDCQQHINAKHGGNGKVKKRAKHGDDSFASRAIEAELAIACGEQTDDAWLLP
jgi:uncharacterized C2H2 Zn-finger protein